MAFDIQHYDGTVQPVSGALPYGDIKDAVLGGDGTKANNKSNQALQQFIMRMMANAGITPNNLLESATNGFQVSQALNTLIANPLNAFAESVGASGLVPVILSGMRITGTTTVNVTAGYFFYNGQLVFFPGGSVTPTSGNSAYIFLTTGGLDGMPVSTIGQDSTTIGVTPTFFPISAIVPYLTTANLQGQITTNNTISAWTTITVFNASWQASTVFAAVPRYTKDTSGRIKGSGAIDTTTGGVGGGAIFTLPTGYRPSQSVQIALAANLTPAGGGTSYWGVVAITVATNGIVTALTGLAGPQINTIFLDDLDFFIL